MARKRRKKKSACNGLLCFHGAFKRKSDAEARERKHKGAFIFKKFGNWGSGTPHSRYIVATKDKAAEFNFGANR